MTTPSDETQPSRRGRARAIAGDAGTVGGGAFARMGFSDPTLVLRWREIAGPETARLCQPLRLTADGALTLKALPGAALFLGHETRALIGRINQYLGRPAVSRLKFVQGVLTPPPLSPKLRRAPRSAAATDPVHRYAGPDGLKEALLQLARWRESGKS